MSKARELAELGAVYDSGALANRNLVINGAMQVSQRGTSEASVTSSQYADAPDRFKFEISSAGTWTLSQSTDVPSGSGFSNSYKVDCTTADASLGSTDYVQLSHYMEGQDLQRFKKGTSSAESMTVSFWVKSAKTGTYILEFYDGDNSRSNSQSYTIDAANTWEHKKITVPGDTSGAFDNDANLSLGLFFILGVGSTLSSGTLNTSWNSRVLANVAVGQVNLADSTSNDWYLTGVQLEVGESATPFEHRSFGDELERCQRYYQVSHTADQGYVNASQHVGFQAFYAREMRAVPTVTLTLSSGGQNNITTPLNVYINRLDSYHGYVTVTAAGNWYFYYNATSDAEL
jgi:hypothetical protein